MIRDMKTLYGEMQPWEVQISQSTNRSLDATNTTSMLPEQVKTTSTNSYLIIRLFSFRNVRRNASQFTTNAKGAVWMPVARANQKYIEAQIIRGSGILLSFWWRGFPPPTAQALHLEPLALTHRSAIQQQSKSLEGSQWNSKMLKQKEGASSPQLY
jgi:hypothetical protein